MSKYEISSRVSFAIERYRDLNPDWGLYDLDDITNGLSNLDNFEDLPEKTKKFVEEMEYSAFKEGITPPFFEPPIEIDEDAPLTDVEKEMLKGIE